MLIDILTQLKIDRYSYILMQNTDTRPSTTRYQKQFAEIKKYINLYIIKFNNQIRVSYYCNKKLF